VQIGSVLVEFGQIRINFNRPRARRLIDCLPSDINSPMMENTGYEKNLFGRPKYTERTHRAPGENKNERKQKHRNKRDI
jgi:hypothetical protein